MLLLPMVLACSGNFVRQRLWAISPESQRSRWNRWRTKCTEHANKKIGPSQDLNFAFFWLKEISRLILSADSTWPHNNSQLRKIPQALWGAKGPAGTKTPKNTKKHKSIEILTAWYNTRIPGLLHWPDQGQVVFLRKARESSKCLFL